MARNRLFSALPPFRRGALALCVVTVLTTALLADQPIARQLLLDPGAAARGEGLWQPITANFIFPDGGASLLLGTILVQWFLAGPLENFWGTRKYLTLVVGCGVAGYVATVLLALGVPAVAGVVMGGSTAMDLAAVVAFGAFRGARPLQLGGVISLSGRTLAIIIAALSVVSPLARGAEWPVVIPGVVSMLVALLVVTQPWRRLRKSGKVGGRRRKQRPAHLRVIRPDDDLLN